MRTLHLAALGILLLTSTTASAQFSGLFGPSNYDECVLENMKGISSDMAARAVAGSCRNKFPRESPQENIEAINEVKLCRFIYQPQTRSFRRLDSNDEERPSMAEYELITFIRERVSFDERAQAAQDLVEADKSKSPILPVLKSLYRSLSKEVYFPKGLSADFMQTQESRVPSCL